MDDEIITKRILKNYLENIFRLADVDYQERVWVRNEGPECGDLEDRIGDFFDNGDSIFGTPERFHFTDHQFKLLLRLRKKLDDFDVCRFARPYRSDEELIKLPEWQEIRDLSQEILQAFNFKKIPRIDKEILQRILETFLEKLAFLSEEKPEHDGMDSLIDWFFNEGDPIFESPEQFACFNYHQFTLLLTLQKKLKNFRSKAHRSVKELIALPEWQEIRDLAKEILRTFDNKKS